MTLTRKERFESLRESSMERIEKAALELFAQKGYGHTSISQIAREAGISKGLMYNYYDGKESLLHALVRKGISFGDELLKMGTSFLPDQPAALLETVIEFSFREVRSHPVYWKLLMSLAFQEEVIKTIAPEIEQQKESHMRMGKTIFEQLGYPHPESRALFFAATLDGIFLHYILSPRDYPLESVKTRLIETFCKKFEP